MKRLVYCVLLVLFTVQPALALTSYKEVQDNSPVVITDCNSRHIITNYSYTLNSITFVNISHIPITNIQFRLVFINEYKKALFEQFVNYQGFYSPNILIQPEKFYGLPQFQNKIMDTLPGWSDIICGVQSVRFIDGSYWQSRKFVIG